MSYEALSPLIKKTGSLLWTRGIPIGHQCTVFHNHEARPLRPHAQRYVGKPAGADQIVLVSDLLEFRSEYFSS